MDRVFEETSNIATKDILATVIPTNQSAVKMITCECGNRDPACTIRDLKSGDNICLGIGRKGCGRVLQVCVEFTYYSLSGLRITDLSSFFRIILLMKDLRNETSRTRR